MGGQRRLMPAARRRHPLSSRNGVAPINRARADELDMRQQHLVAADKIHVPHAAHSSRLARS